MEMIAHLLLAATHPDPFLSFRYGAVHSYAAAALGSGSNMLTGGSTLLLAMYWVRTPRARNEGEEGKREGKVRRRQHARSTNFRAKAE